MDERDKALLLALEVDELQEKFDKTHNGQIRDRLVKKRYILRHMLNQILKPDDKQQTLFEAK